MQMEGIETFDRYGRSSNYYNQRRTDSRRCSPRLPTPEASRSSNGSLDESIPRDYIRRGAPIPALLSGYSPDHSMMPAVSNTTYTRDGRRYIEPQSPPYQAADRQKPSLPPLKTILGDTMSSPPDTPQTQEAPYQPSPCEPAFTASPYKPTAFYPNKKARTDRGIDSSPQFHHSSGLVSPAVPSSSRDIGVSYRSRRTSVAAFQPASRSDLEGRRLSLLPGFAPSHESYQYGRAFLEAPQRQHEQTRYRSPERTASPPASAPFFGRSIPPRASVPVETQSSQRNTCFAYPMEQSVSRRSSIQSHRDYPPPSNYDNRRSGYHHPPTPHYALPMRDDYASKDHHHLNRLRHPTDKTPGYTRTGYPDTQPPAFFMPSHYDCQLGKTRKRSNLPKQSTEIMKTWFDQNITNPYPSEEQKAIFSNATGISMTQVSNWFINHRRRCPELRDNKKNKSSRAGEGD